MVHFIEGLLCLLSLAMAPPLMAQSGILDNFTAPKLNPASGENYWESYDGFCTTKQTYTIANGQFTLNCCPAGANVGMCYWHFLPYDYSSYPANYVAGQRASGTWQSTVNRLRWKMVCPVMNGDMAYDSSNANLQVGTYIKDHSIHDTQQGAHYYHIFHFNYHQNQPVWLELNMQPQAEVGQGGNFQPEYDPGFNAPSDPGFSSPQHYMDSLTRWYYYAPGDGAQPQWLGATCVFYPVAFDTVAGMPEAYVASVAGYVSQPDAQGKVTYQVGFSSPKNVIVHYDVRYSTSSLRTNNWSTGTADPSGVDSLNSAYVGVLWTSPRMAPVQKMYVGLRPRMDVQSVSASGSGPIQITTTRPALLSNGDHVNVAGVCANANGTRTITNVSLYTVSLSGTAGPCVYAYSTNPGTMTSTSETTGFYEMLIGDSTSGALNKCDVNADGVVNMLDVQLAVNQALGIASCTTGDINGDGVCNVLDVQRVVNASLGQACVTN